MPAILITRPRASAEGLAQELKRLGYEPVIEPLLEIMPLSTPRPEGPFDAVIITSGNAFPALDAKRDAALFNLPCFCVGLHTAQKATSFGFLHVKHADRDGAALARFAGEGVNNASAAFLHIAGKDADGKAQQELQKMGHRVATWPVYEARPAGGLSDKAHALLKNQQLDAVVVYSPRTAATLTGLIEKDALEACCRRLAAICLSDAVAAALQSLPWRQIASAATPAEDVLIARLQEICPVKS